MGLEHLLNVIEFLVPIAKAIPILGSPVEGSLEAVKQIVLLAQDVKNHKQDARDLAQEATRWIHTIVLELSRADPDTLKGAELGVNELHRTLEEMLSTSLQHASRTGIAKAILKASADKEEMRRLRNQLDETFKRFMAASHLRIEIALKELIAAFDRDMLEKKLNPVHLARYDARDSPGECLANTREDILLKLKSWAEEENPGISIFWLTGLAGTGKSTIAKSFCEWLAPRHELLLTFFASRQDAQRRDPLNIVHTFAYELSRTISQVAVHRQIQAAVKSPPEITARELSEQVDRLITQPLSLALAAERFPFFVLDALDECYKIDGLEGGDLVPRLVSQLSEYPVKILVTSRQEDSLVQMFQRLRVHSTIRLQDTEDSVVEADVTRYFEEKFADLRRTSRFKLPEVWPSSDDLKTLVERTGHLFVFASTAMKFIRHPRFHPGTRLQQLLDRHSTSSSSFADLDVLYAQILESAVCANESPSSVDEDLCIRVRDLLAAIVHLQKPLSIASLALLIGLPEAEVDVDVRALSAILLIPDPDIYGSNSMQPDLMALSLTSAAAVQVFHPSLPDFLTDQSRARCYLDGRFFLEPKNCHEQLFRGCLKVMKSLPGVDSCDLPDLLRFDFETSSNMSSALSYACTGWIFHFTRPWPRSILIEEVEQFSRTDLFRRWIIFLCASVRNASSSPGETHNHGGYVVASNEISDIFRWFRACCCHDETVDAVQAVQVIAIELRLRYAFWVVRVIESAIRIVKELHKNPRCRPYQMEAWTLVAHWTEQILVVLECNKANEIVEGYVNEFCQTLQRAKVSHRRADVAPPKPSNGYGRKQNYAGDRMPGPKNGLWVLITTVTIDGTTQWLEPLREKITPLLSFCKSRGILIDALKTHD